MVFRSALGPEELKAAVSETISGIAVDCVEAGTRLIGHIKCIAEVDSGRYVACSAVKHDGEAVCRGEFSGSARNLTLVINVLLYGLDRERVEVIVLKRARSVARMHGGSAELEDLEYHDHECRPDHVHGADGHNDD